MKIFCVNLELRNQNIRPPVEQAELTVNVGKTKTMVFGDNKIEQELTIGDKNIEKVDKFEYLGSLITRNNSWSEEIRKRIGKAPVAMASPETHMEWGKGRYPE